MKVRNIMFSGFAAAILMGTVSANAAGSFEIASKAYVDSKVVTGLTDSEDNPISVAEALETKADAETVGNLDDLVDFDNNPGSIVEALNELETDVTAAQTAADTAQSEVDALETVVATKASQTDLTALTNRVSTAEGEIDGLQNQVGNVAMGTTAGTVTGAIKELNDSISSLTGGAGSVANQISDAIGNIGTHDNGQGQQVSNTVAEALALKADASSLTSHTSDTTIHLTSDEKSAIANLLAAGYADCISTANGSGHCVLTADTNGLSWTLVTSPWVD